MEELKINKIFETREEMEEYIKQLNEEYTIVIVNQIPQVIGEPDIYGIESILHFGKRG